MITTTRLRILRLRNNISLKELHRYSGFSHQYISQLDLGVYGSTPHNEKLIDNAFRSIIASRRAALEQLERDYGAYKVNLLQPVEVEAE